MTEPLNKLLQKTGLWRASRIDNDYKTSRSTGFAALDNELPGSGWPVDGVTEILHDQYGIGELRLLMPVIAQLSQQETRWLLLVNPPYIPYPPALAQAGIDLTRIVVSQPKSARDYLWVLEKALASQSCSLVMSWPGKIHDKQIRRLQVASKEGNSWGLLFRSESAASNPSPAELRIRVRPGNPHRDHSSLTVRVLKRRGGWESPDIPIELGDQLHRPMPDFSEVIVDQPVSSTPDFRLPDIPAPQARHEYQ